MTGPDEAVRAASDAIDAAPAWTPVPVWSAAQMADALCQDPIPGRVEVTYTTAPRIGGEPLSTQEARDLMAQLLAKFDDEADHATENVEEWGPGPNQQTRIWQQRADEKRIYAAALRVMLGLPERQPISRVDGRVCAGCAAEMDPPYEG
jgi:hypothetical protein